MDYVRVVYKRRWVAIPVFFAVLALGAINSYRTTPLYRASTQILIEKDSPKVGDLSTIFQQNDGWYNDDFYQTQYRILQSRSLARKTAEAMRLDKKVRGGQIKFVLAGRIGSVEHGCNVPAPLLKRTLATLNT